MSRFAPASMVSALLSHGHFPFEVPPGFHGEDLGRLVDTGVVVPAPRAPRKTIVPFSVPRYGGVRRLMGIPHPEPQLTLASLIETNRATLAGHFAKSLLATSTPVFRASGRPVGYSHGPDGLAQRRMEISAGYRYELRTDIAFCYPSIYTHAIPWALHTKAWAKRNPHARCLGNDLDRAVQATNAGQTKGIPIGPDTSKVIAETLLTQVDLDLQEEMGPAPGLRHVDDYWFFFETRHDAESFLGRMQRVLSEYELALNPRKTAIRDMPTSAEAAWVHELRTFAIRTSRPDVESADVTRFFDLAVRHASANPDEPVLGYAMSRLAKEVDAGRYRGNRDAVNVLLSVFLHATARESITIHDLFRLVRALETEIAKKPGQVRQLNRVLNAFILRHLAAYHSFEVGWAMTHFILFPMLELTEHTMKALLASNDAFSLILLAEYMHRRDLGVPLGRFSAHALDDSWLAAYELGAHYGNGPASKLIAADGFFSDLASRGVRFYHPPTGPAHVSMPSWTRGGGAGAGY